ncbi:mucin-7-like isoform X2 [Hyperolius riggenbachi]
MTESPLAATGSSIENATHLQDSSTSVTALADVTHGEQHNEGVAATDPHIAKDSSTKPGLEFSTGPPVVTRLVQEASTDSDVTSDSALHTDPKPRDPTGPNFTQPPPTTHLPRLEDATTETTTNHTESPLLLSTAWVPSTETRLSTENPPESAQPEATTARPHPNSASTITASTLVTTTLTTAQPTSPSTLTTPSTYTARTAVQRDPSGLEVGGNKDLPSFHSGSSSNPLFVMIVSVFTIMVVMVVVAVGFHRYKKRNRRTEFRRLQDLPMDDMMEDTPLSLYSY